jgi:hypothetical protein
VQIRQSLRAWHQLAVGRKDGRDANQVLRGNAGVAEGELKRSEALAMFPHTFGEEDFLGDHVLAQFSFLQKIRIELILWSEGQSNTVICEDCMKKTGISRFPQRSPTRRLWQPSSVASRWSLAVVSERWPRLSKPNSQRLATNDQRLFPQQLTPRAYAPCSPAGSSPVSPDR